jgi:hypothetical protein
MNISPAELEALRAICPSAKPMSEGGDQYVYLPGLEIEAGGRVRILDAMLGLTLMNGYSTRLFLSEPITERPTIEGKPANWTAPTIFGRVWHTWSWQGVPRSQPAISILLEHLRALK